MDPRSRSRRRKIKYTFIIGSLCLFISTWIITITIPKKDKIIDGINQEIERVDRNIDGGNLSVTDTRFLSISNRINIFELKYLIFNDVKNDYRMNLEKNILNKKIELLISYSNVWRLGDLVFENTDEIKQGRLIMKEDISYQNKNSKLSDLSVLIVKDMESRLYDLQDEKRKEINKKVEIENEKECWRKWFVIFQIGGLFLSGLSGVLVKSIKIGIGVVM